MRASNLLLAVSLIVIIALLNMGLSNSDLEVALRRIDKLADEVQALKQTVNSLTRSVGSDSSSAGDGRGRAGSELSTAQRSQSISAGTLAQLSFVVAPYLNLDSPPAKPSILLSPEEVSFSNRQIIH